MHYIPSDVLNELIFRYSVLVLFPYHLKNMPSNCHISHHNLQIYVISEREKKGKIN